MKVRSGSLCETILNMLPSVEEFTVSNYLSIRDVVRFIHEKKSLKEISFRLDNFGVEIPDIQKRLKDKWHGEKKKYNPFVFTQI